MGKIQLKRAVEQLVKPTVEEMDEFLDKFTSKIYKKKEVILGEGKICRHVWFINKGLVRDFYHRDNAEHTSGFYFENSFISNYGSFINRKPATESLDALEDCEMLMISYDALQALYNRSKVWERYGRLIAERLFLMAEKRKDDLMADSPEWLYMRLLQDQSPIIQRVPQYYIASFLGISPEHLSRIRKKI